MRKTGGGLVYSTESGRMCPACRQPLAACACAAQRTTQGATGGAHGAVRVSRESKGRGGKTVTLVRGVARDAAALEALGRSLRATCGSGGTVKDGIIEVQGDHVERVIAALAKDGIAAKRSGG